MFATHSTQLSAVRRENGIVTLIGFLCRVIGFPLTIDDCPLRTPRSSKKLWRGCTDEHLVHVPAPTRIGSTLNSSLSDLGSKHRTEPVPPETYCLVADVDAALEQNVLDLAPRQWVADIQLHREPDHLG